MRRKMKKLPAYYSVFSVKDGTIWMAMTARKPTGAAPRSIDEDGIFNFYVDKLGEEQHFTDTAKVIRGATIATCLNFKRVLRDQVEGHLAEISRQIVELKSQVDHLEQSLQHPAGGREGPAGVELDS